MRTQIIAVIFYNANILYVIGVFFSFQVAIAFWKAMGGEDDEISGLDDSD